jgi:hypothetical protein
MISLLLALAAPPSELDRTETIVEDGPQPNEMSAGVIGVRLGMTNASDRQIPTATSAQVGGRGEELRSRGIVTAHGSHSWSIGGGSSGFEGGLALAFAVGARLPIHRAHGPFVRLGARGLVEGNGAFYDSALELPRTEVGWQYLRGWVALEIGATYGLLVAGRFRLSGAETRVLGDGFASGLYAAAQFPMVRVGATAQHLPAKDGEAVLSATLYGCALGSYVALCVDGRWMRGDVVFSNGAREITSIYTGVLFGVVPPNIGAARPPPNGFAGNAKPMF